MKKKKKYLETNEYAKGIQISLSFSKNMFEDPYLVNGEHFYKIRITLRYLEPLLALGVLISFFLPWFNHGLMHSSAYELLKLDNFESIRSFFFFLPLLALFIVFLSKLYKLKTLLSLILGFFPFIFIMILSYSEKLELLELEDFLYGFYIYLFLSILLIFLPLYKIFNKTTLLNKKKIAFNSKLLKPWLAFGLLASFFLPWLNFNLFYMSPYALLIDENYGEKYWFLLFIPFLSVVLLLCYKFNLKLKILSFLTGISTYIAVFLVFLSTDKNLLNILCLGSYISLLLGAGLIFLSMRINLKKMIIIFKEIF